MAEHQTRGTYVSWKPCGCLAMAVVDEAEHANLVATEVARAIRRGERIERLPVETVRTMDWKCESHKAMAAPRGGF